jgi:tRNA G18 (ribose-2'-O)-methylase SpoU
MDLAKPLALALGSEGAGLPRVFESAGILVSIPMASQVESLNVATAASILLYEVARQRSLGNLGSRGGERKGD